MRLYIFGASGAGVTTLGMALAQRYNAVYRDSDDYLWLPTDPPYTTKRDKPERNAALIADLQQPGSVVLGGCIHNWHLPVMDTFDLAVFLYVPPEERLARIRMREQARFGDRIDTHPVIGANFNGLMDWTALYDQKDSCERTLDRHESWIARLTIPVLEIRGSSSIDERLYSVMEKIQNLGLDTVN